MKLGCEEIRETLARMRRLSEELRGIQRRFDTGFGARFPGYEEITCALRSISEDAEEDVDRIRNMGDALDKAIAAYTEAERETGQVSETLPTAITERGLVFEPWFNAYLI